MTLPFLKKLRQADQEVFHVKLGSDARKTRGNWTRTSRGNQGKSRAKDTLFGTRMTAECVAEILWTACDNFAACPACDFGVRFREDHREFGRFSICCSLICVYFPPNVSQSR